MYIDVYVYIYIYIYVCIYIYIYIYYSSLCWFSRPQIARRRAASLARRRAHPTNKHIFSDISYTRIVISTDGVGPPSRPQPQKFSNLVFLMKFG